MALAALIVARLAELQPGALAGAVVAVSESKPTRRRPLPTFRQETIGQEDAFAEGERERRERLRSNRPDVLLVPLVGGPLDGGRFRVPRDLLASAGPDAHAEHEFPVRLPAMSDRIIIPGERPRSAIYRLDRSMNVLQFTGQTIVLGGPR